MGESTFMYVVETILLGVVLLLLVVKLLVRGRCCLLLSVVPELLRLCEENDERGAGVDSGGGGRLAD